MVFARIGWGLRGKPAGSYDDYRILESGGSAFAPGDIAGILSRYSLGNPPADRDGPSALPWVALSEVRDAEQHYLGLAVHNWSRDVDASGRQISISRYFYVPFKVMSEAAVSYQGLFTALSNAELVNGRELELELAGGDLEAQAHSIQQFGFQRVAMAAAMLLEGRVTVTSAQDLTFAQRIAFLDAVAALLPYGWRTKFSAGTWHESGSKYVKLAFARHNRPESFELNWRSPAAEPPSGSTDARDYFSQLKELTAPGRRSLVEIVRHFSLEPSVENAAHAARLLNDIDFPEVVLRLANAQQASREDLRKLLTSQRLGELRTDPDRRTILSEFIRVGEIDDLALVEQVWDKVDAAKDPAAFGRLVQVGRDCLWSENQRRGYAERLGTAERLNLGDRYLAQLLVPPNQEGPAGLRVAAQLVRTRMGQVYPHTLKALAESAPVVCELITQIEPHEFGRWHRMLGNPVWLEPFANLLGASPKPADGRSFTIVAAKGRDCVRTFLSLAAVRGHFGQTLLTFASWLAASGESNPEFWSAQLRLLKPSAPADQGVLDAILLWLGAEPRFLDQVSTYDRPYYEQSFLQVYRLAALQDQILTNLNDHLNRWSWPTRDADVSAVGGLVAALSVVENPRLPILLDTVHAGRAVNPDLMQNTRIAGMSERTAGRYPDVVKNAPRTNLTRVAPEASPAIVAKLLTEAIREEINYVDALRLLFESGWIRTGDTVANLLVETRRALLAAGYRASSVDDAVQNMASHIMRGGSMGLRNDLRKHAAEQSIRALDFHLELLRITAADQSEPDQLHLDPDVRDRLGDLSHKAGTMGKKSRWKLT